MILILERLCSSYQVSLCNGAKLRQNEMGEELRQKRDLEISAEIAR